MKIFKNFEKYIRECPNNFVQDCRPSDSEGIGSVEEGDVRRSATVGSKASDGGQAQQCQSKERQRRSE